MSTISLLNSIIGPVMRGPSSSHSAAPYFLGKTIQQLAVCEGDKIVGVEIAFDPGGSFAQVYTNQGSDEGFAAGLVGEEINSPSYRHALPNLLKGQPFPLKINIRQLEVADHPNRVEIAVSVEDREGIRRQECFKGLSIGGGMFKVDGLDGYEIDVSGSDYMLLVECGNNVVPEQFLSGEKLQAHTRQSPDKNTQLIEIKSPYPFSHDAPFIQEILDQSTRVRSCAPVQFPVRDEASLFASSADLLEQASINGSLADLALSLEAKRLGLSQSEARKAFADRLDIMIEAVHSGLALTKDSSSMKFLEPGAKRVAAADPVEVIGSPFLQGAISASLGVMDANANRGVVVAAPTAGSSGIVPGTLYSLQQQGIDRERIIDALQVTALIGAVFAEHGSFAAETGGCSVETGGCSVETGASAAMMSAGLVHLFGGSAQQAFSAASLCLMNTLGLVCDPVGGEVEIPCHARNIAGISHTQSAAVASLSGFDAVLPFDEMVVSTQKVGKQMHSDLRCTARGGCAATPTACDLCG
ncbi:L-serine dehydratase, iron-sulfur-dependent, alpha subunit [Pseudovibrio sp. FO-BEG1]|uniref:L-serine ammonia-lyase, iron-sulfur-dependent, subunit alpha n=1 Tax=Pseudovibrio sp. (strain FO-BEG1) TaxID=911045 RepID=UPI000238D358|nr:L-serine ammonia-lyase, iron-sulfur-dependent, subunit alpha [Pseudovibrio sp. FO-BEG1]AEV36408.1 L-serine dehydratase, iron-sulfur-dependent, alpha subunit [Pseudovibrio sp. FO-BEG1]